MIKDCSDVCVVREATLIPDLICTLLANFLSVTVLIRCAMRCTIFQYMESPLDVHFYVTLMNSSNRSYIYLIRTRVAVRKHKSPNLVAA